MNYTLVTLSSVLVFCCRPPITRPTKQHCRTLGIICYSKTMY